MEQSFLDRIAGLPTEAEMARMSRKQLAKTCAELLSAVRTLTLCALNMQAENHALLRMLNTNSGNSGIPPSQDRPWDTPPRGRSGTSGGDDAPPPPQTPDAGESGAPEETATPKDEDKPDKPTGADTSEGSGSSSASQKNVGAKKGHPPFQQKLLEPDNVIHCRPGVCSCGCHEFEDERLSRIHQYQEIPKIPVEVTHFHILHGTCSNCGKEVKGKLPKEYSTGFGPNLSAFLVGLNLHGMTRRSILALVQDVGLVHTKHGQGARISHGGLNAIIKRASACLEPHHDKLAEIARTTAVNNIDETRWPTFGPLLGKAKRWLWTMTSKLVTFFHIHTNRSKAAFEELIGPWRGFLISDDYSLYLSWDKALRQSCTSHHKRKTTKLSQDPVPDIAQVGEHLYSLICRIMVATKSTVSESEWQQMKAELRALVDQHKDRKDLLGTYASRLDKTWESLFTFWDNPEVESTNNAGERSIRPAVVRRKISYGSTSEDGILWIERALSVMQTCRQQGWSLFEYLRESMTNYLKGLPQDLSRYDGLMQQAQELRKKLGLDDPAPAGA